MKLKQVFVVFVIIFVVFIISKNIENVRADFRINSQSFWKSSSENLSYNPNFKDVHYLNLTSIEDETNITVLNIFSYPLLERNWTVRFNTTGTANLTITTLPETNWSLNRNNTDLNFLELKCGNETVPYQWIENEEGNPSVFVENWHCNKTAYETSKVLTQRKHELLFKFGDSYATAHNTVIFGNTNVFNNDNTYFISTTVLDSSHFILVYVKDSSPDGIARIGTVSGSTISFGDEYEFNSDTSGTACVALDSSHFVVVYLDGGSTLFNGYGKAKIGTVSGSTISFGNEYQFTSDETWYLSIEKLDSSHFVVGYSISLAAAKIGTVSGSTISFGDEYINSYSSQPTNMDIAMLDDTHFVMIWTIYGGDRESYASIGTVSGSTISYGNKYEFQANSTTSAKVEGLDSSHFVVGYRDSEQNRGEARIGTVSGSTISFGDEYEFHLGDLAYTSIKALDSNHFILGYSDYAVDYAGAVNKGTVSGSSISFGNQYRFIDNSDYLVRFVSVSILDSSHFIVASGGIYNGAEGVSRFGNANIVPAASSVSDSPDPQNVGYNITFSGSWTEENSEDTVKMYICKDSGCTNCDSSSQSNCWCYSSSWQTEPDTSDACTYTAQVDDASDNSYWLGVCDEDGCDSSPLSGGTFGVNPDSCTPPVSGDWVINCNDNCSKTSENIAVNGNIVIYGNNGGLNFDQTNISATGFSFNATNCKVTFKQPFKFSLEVA